MPGRGQSYSRAMLSFVVLVARSLPSDSQRRLERAGMNGLFFEPAAMVTQRNEHGTIAVAAWERRVGPIPAGPHWIEGQMGLLGLSGYGVSATSCAGDANWLVPLCERAEQRGPAVIDGLWGTFCMLWVPKRGAGFVATDPLGTSVLFTAERDGVVAISNRSALAAYAITPEGREPARDVTGPAWYVAFDTLADDSTGYADVRAVPSYQAITFTPSGTVGTVDLNPIGAVEGDHAEDLIDATWDEMRAHVRDLPGLGATRIGLTGGRDSRLLLAAAIAEGMVDQLNFFTMAAFPGDADPLVASMLAETFDLRHKIITASGAARTSEWFEMEMRVHAFKSSGIFPGTALRGALTPPPQTRVSGSFAEHLHDLFAGRPAPTTLDEAHTILIGRQTPEQIGICSTDALVDHRQRLRAILAEIYDRGVPAADLLFHFRLEQRVHRWFSAQVEMSDIRPGVHPMYSVAGVRAALAVGCENRLSERLHFDLMRRSDARLAELPFEMYGWHEALFRDIPDGRARYGKSPVVGPTTPKGLGGLLWHNHRAVYERYLLDDVSNPLQSVLDRSRVEAVLRGGDDLAPPTLRQLNNALAAAIWLGHHEATTVIPLSAT